MRKFFVFIIFTISFIACRTEAENAAMPALNSATATVRATTQSAITAVADLSTPSPPASATSPAARETATAELPTLPPFVSYQMNQGQFPTRITWILDSELPKSPSKARVLNSNGQTTPLNRQQAEEIAQRYGFEPQLYVQLRGGMTVSQTADLGLFAVFDGPRTLSLAGQPYHYSEFSAPTTGPDLPFGRAAPIAEKTLLEKGWLTFPYEIAESADGIIFLPVIEGMVLPTPTFSVRVNADGQVYSVFIYDQDSPATFGDYPIISAEEAWARLQENPNHSAVFWSETMAPADESSPPFPTIIRKEIAPGQTAEVYTNIWAYAPLDGNGTLIIGSSEFDRINGEADMLAEMAKHSDSLLQLRGIVSEDQPGRKTLLLSEWESVPDAGGLPTFFGVLEQEGDQWILFDQANNQSYLLPDAPSGLQAGNDTAVAGLPQMIDGINSLVWMEITIYPQYAQVEQPAEEPNPYTLITINHVRFVYAHLPATISGTEKDFYFPSWEFTGVADNGQAITLQVIATPP